MMIVISFFADQSIKKYEKLTHRKYYLHYTCENIDIRSNYYTIYSSVAEAVAPECAGASGGVASPQKKACIASSSQFKHFCC